jgi:hypothetical protein
MCDNGYMSLRQRFAPIVAVLTNKTVVIAACAAVALFLGALSAGSLVFFHKKLPFNLGKADSSTVEPGKRRTSSTSSGVASAQTETTPLSPTGQSTVSAKSNTASVIKQNRNNSPVTAQDPVISSPPPVRLPALPKKPVDTAQPVPLNVSPAPSIPLLPPVQQPVPNTDKGLPGLDLGLDLTVHVGLPLLNL